MDRKSDSSSPLISNALATQLGIIPIRKRGPVRFAVGPPDGYTSNCWRMWTTKYGDIYIACRDNFQQAKVSLHTSGRWRMGFTTEATVKNQNLVPKEQNRAWEVWDEPRESLPNTIIAFRLLFPVAELAVKPEQRIAAQWKDVIYIEPAATGKLTLVTLFVTTGDIQIAHESEPSFCLASLDIGNNRYAQLIVHRDPELDIYHLIESSVAESRRQAEVAGVSISEDAYGYYFGRRDDGSRFIVGARVNRHN